ncbi:MAG: DUF3341 domain-containing protein [Planctomycetota bacterium]
MAVPIYKTSSGAVVHGILAQFENPHTLTEAAKKVRDVGYDKWDTHAPFPVHEMEESMGIAGKAVSPLAYVIGMAALTGAVGGYLMQWWINYDYFIVVQGKPTHTAWESFIPVTFELGILFTAFAAIFGMLAFNGLPRHHHPLFNSERFLSVSDDAFFISVQAKDPLFDPDATRAMLEEAGATHVELVEE